MKEFNKISDFIDGNLSSAEQAQFEQSLNNNKSLKADVNRHKMLIKGIKAARHNELKTRLAAIPVVAGIALRTKIIIGVTTICTASLAFIGYQELLNKPIQTTPVVIEKPTEKKIVNNFVQTTIEKRPKIESTISENLIEKEKKIKPAITSSKNNSTDNKKIDDNVIQQAAPDIQAFTNPFEELNELPVKNSDGNVQIDNISSSKSITKSVIVPKIEKSKTLQYLYDSNNLTLYGDFSSEEYLILDYRHINKVYLYFNESFYELEIKKRKTPLEGSLVTDPSLKSQLYAELQE